MSTTDERIDAYIAKSKDFARPILEHLRAVVHAACPEVEETMKWGFPHFMYQGMLCSMASFNAHCAFGFWNGALIVEQEGAPAEAAMGQFGRITSVKDLPAKRVLTKYVKQAMALNESGVKPPSRAKRPSPKPVAEVPAELAAALRKNRKAREVFEGFPPSHRREYIEWITDAKRDETRARRVAQAVEWIAEGKGRNWKYER